MNSYQIVLHRPVETTLVLSNYEFRPLLSNGIPTKGVADNPLVMGPKGHPETVKNLSKIACQAPKRPIPLKTNQIVLS